MMNFDIFTTQQIDYLDTHFDKRYEQKFVSIENCNDNQNAINKKLANDDKRIEVLITQQKINNWLTTAIACGIITLVIKIFIGD